MVIYVLDTSALLRFVDDEAGAERVADIFREQADGAAKVLMCAVHWGEVAHGILKRHGAAALDDSLHRLKALGVEIVPADEGRSARTATTRHRYNYKIPYADAFGVELASHSSRHVLVTADFDVKPAEQDISVEFLPPKPKA
jgi:predicted nucleic acid-binding protein